MSNLKLTLLVTCLWIVGTVLSSCKKGAGTSAEPLDETKARQCIKDYVRNNGFEHLDELIAQSAIHKFEPMTPGVDHLQSIRTTFINEGKTKFTVLIFNFDKSVKDQWILNSVRSSGQVSNELSNWLAKKTSLNIPVK